MFGFFWGRPTPGWCVLSLSFPNPTGKPRGDDRQVSRGAVFIERNGLRRRDALAGYGPPKTLCNRWKRWGHKGIFGIFARRMGPDDGGFGRQSRRGKDGRDRRDLSEGTSGASQGGRFGRRKGRRGRPVGRIGGGMNARLHAIRRTARVGLPTRSSPPLRSAIALEHGHCRTACQRSPGCSGIGTMTPPGSETG